MVRAEGYPRWRPGLAFGAHSEPPARYVAGSENSMEAQTVNGGWRYHPPRRMSRVRDVVWVRRVVRLPVLHLAYVNLIRHHGVRLDHLGEDHRGRDHRRFDISVPVDLEAGGLVDIPRDSCRRLPRPRLAASS